MARDCFPSPAARFGKNYNGYEFVTYEVSAEVFFIHFLNKIYTSILTANVDCLRKQRRILNYVIASESECNLQMYFNSPRNLLRSTNIIIFTCKCNALEILEYVFSSEGRPLHLLPSLISLDGVKPDDRDEESHNAFYYSIRSGNCRLLETLVHKWPGGIAKEIMDKLLSRAYRELKLRHVPLTPEMEAFVASQLIDIRFFTNSSLETKETTLDDIKGRISLVLECIDMLKDQYSNKSPDEVFLFVAKFIAQNIFILKAGLKSTYAVIPWEEMYFYLEAFISWIIKSDTINVFSPSLTKNNMLKHLSNFSVCLKSEMVKIKDLKKLFILPRRKRKAIVQSITDKYPLFKDLYHDFIQIRDVYSLNVISHYIELSLSINCEEKDKHLVISRSLQVIGENLKDSVESPRLSKETSDLLMLSLSGWTKQIISETRDALSHTEALSTRFEVERKSGDEFFNKISDDFQKLKAVIASLLYVKKIEVFKEVFQQISDGERESEMEEILNYFFVGEWEDIVATNHTFTNLEQVKNLVEQISSMIKDKTMYESKLFEQIQEILDDEIYNADLAKYSYFKHDETIQAVKQFYKFQSKLGDFPLKKMAEMILRSMSERKNSVKVSDILREIISVVVKKIKNKDGLDLLYKLTNILLFKMPNMECMQGLRDTLIKIGYHEQQRPVLSQDAQIKLEDQMMLEKISNLKKECKSINLSEKNFIFLKNGEEAKAVREMHLLDLLNVTLARKKLTRNVCFLDSESPLLIGKNLRDHVAHGNVLEDLLFFKSHVMVELNLRKFVLEDTLQGSRLIDQRMNNDISMLRENFNRDLNVISNQKSLFKALEVGNFEDAENFLRKGADLNAKDIFLGNAFHFAAKGSRLDTLYFIAVYNSEFNCKDVNGKSPLHVACEYGRYDLVEFFLKQKDIEIDATDCHGQTALHYAAKFGYSHIVNIMLKHGAHADVLDKYNGFPLHYAVINNHLDVFELIAVNESVYEADFIHTAAWSGSTEIIQLLLRKGIDVNDENFLRQSPLHVAARSGKEEIAKLLMKQGANINARATSECTPLITAALFGKEKVVDILLQAGADFTVSDVSGSQPLHCASKQGHLNVVKKLIQYKAPVNSKTVAGKTPLIIASEEGYKEIVAYLLEHGANVNALTELKETALHLSTYCGHYEIVDLLLKNGAYVNAKDELGFTPLHFAVYISRKDIVELFLEECNISLMVDAENYEKQTPLFIAASVGFSDFEMLIKAGANTDHKDIKNSSLIHRCAVGGNSKMTQYLIDEGTDINLTNNDGNTPLHFAILFDNLDVAKILIANGAHININNKENVTPLYLSVKKNNLEILQFLISINEDIDAYSQLIAVAIREGFIDALTLLLKIKNINVNSHVHAGEELLNRLYRETNLHLVAEQDIDTLENEKFSTLYLAAIHGNAGIVKLLIQKGANVNFQTPVLKETPLIIASEFGHLKIVKILLNAKADPNIADVFGQAPIHHASKCGHFKVVKRLLKNKADVNIKDKNDSTPLLCAISGNHLSIVKLILSQKDVELNTGIFNFKHEYPLLPDSILFSAIAGHQRIVEVFLENYSKETFFSFSSLLLEIATVGGSSEVVKYLIDLGADVNAPFKTENHEKPLHFAAYHDKEDIVAILLANGAYYDADDEFGNKSWEGRENKARRKLASTESLHVAVKTNNLEKVERSIAEGAFLNAKSVEEGATPLFNAVWKDNHEIIKVLLKYKADPNCITKRGYTPLHLAAFYGKCVTVTHLLANGAIYNSMSNKGSTPITIVQNSDISFVLHLIENSFNGIHNYNSRVIHELESLKDFQTIRALMKCLNREHRTLIMEAIFHNFKNATLLEEMFLKDLFIFRKWSKQLFNAGKYEQALNIQKLIQKVCEDLLGNSGPSWLDIQQNIGFLLHKQHKFTSALIIFEDIYTKLKQLYGENNFRPLHAKALIAIVLHYQGNYQESLDTLNTVYSKQTKNLPENSEYLFFYKKYIIQGMIKLGLIRTASIICNPLLQSSKETFGECCCLTLSIQEVLASVFCAEKKYEQAFQVYDDICKKRERVLGPNHIDTLRSYRNIATMFSERRKQEAMAIYLQVLLPQLDIFGNSHIESLLTVYGMANCYHKNDSYSKAYGAYSYILPKLQEIVDDTHPVIKDILKKMKKIEIYFQSMYEKHGEEVGKRSSEVYDFWFRKNIMNWFIPRTFYNQQILFNSNNNNSSDKVSKNEKVYL